MEYIMASRKSFIFILALVVGVLINGCSSGAENNNRDNSSAYITFSHTGIIPVFHNSDTTIKILVSNNTKNDVSNVEFNNDSQNLVTVSGCRNIKANSDCIVTAKINLTQKDQTSFSHLVKTSFTVNNNIIKNEHWLQFQAMTKEEQPGVHISSTYINNKNKSTIYLYATGSKETSYNLSGIMFNDHESAIINQNELTQINSGEVLPIYVDGNKLTAGNVLFSSNVQANKSSLNFKLEQTLNVTSNTSNKDAIVSFVSAPSIANLTESKGFVTHTLFNEGNIPVTLTRGDIESPLYFGVESGAGLDYGTCFNNLSNNVLESGSSCTVKVSIAPSSETGLGKFKLIANYFNSDINKYKNIELEQYVGWHKTTTNGKVVLSSPVQTFNIGAEETVSTTVKIDNLSDRSVNIQNLTVSTTLPMNKTLNWTNCQTIAARSSCQATLTMQANSTDFGSSLVSIVALIDNSSSKYNAALSPIRGTLIDNRKTLNYFNVYGVDGIIDNNANTITVNGLATWIYPDGHAANFTATGDRVTINGVTQVSGVTKNDYLARYGDPRYGGNPFLVTVVAKDGSSKTYNLIMNTDTVTFTANAFDLIYTSDVNNVKSYRSKGCNIAIDPVTGQLTSYLPDGNKFWVTDPNPNNDKLARVLFQGDYRLNAYNVVTGGYALWSSATNYGPGYEMVLYGCDFYLQDRGRTDIFVNLNGENVPIVCGTFGSRVCIPNFRRV